MNRILYTLFAFCFFSVSFAQENVEFAKENFVGREDAFKSAMKELKTGRKFYNKGLGYYSRALDHLKEANMFNPHNAKLNYQIAICYLNTYEKERASHYLRNAYGLDSTVSPDYYYQLGHAYQIEYKFDEAINALSYYKKNLSREDKTFSIKLEKANKKLSECFVARELVKDTLRVFVDNLGPGVNSKWTDAAPVVMTDETQLYFTAKRKDALGGMVDGVYDEDIYYSEIDSTGWEWLPAKNVGKPLNTEENDATVALTPDGEQMLIYYGSAGGDILIAEKDGEVWDDPSALPDIINTEGHESSASLSFDGKRLYFTSNFKEGLENFGYHDIYYSDKNEKGKWTAPVNLGKKVNSKYDERDVFMHPDGKTLYFTSNNEKTMGGFDIFKTVMQPDSTWSEPENLGFPINTPQDERTIVITGNGKHGYFSSVRKEGFGQHDIYKITFLGPEKQLIQSNEDNLLAGISNPIEDKSDLEKVVEIRTSRLTVVKGVIIDGLTEDNKPLQATIDLFDNETGELVSTMQSNKSSGKFLVPLPSGKDYGIAVKKDGYLFHSENFNIPPTTAYQEIDLEIRLLPLAENAKMILKNVFFERASADLSPKSYSELDRLIKLLKDNPTVKIEISGHTDNDGSRKTNQALSERRAKSVYNYLIKEIEPERLTFKGYAFDEPIATNDTEEGRAMNRRVEAKIISLK